MIRSRPIKNYILSHLRTWHRRLGITAAAFILFLSMSGILLNHADAMRLADKPVTLSFLLDWYGIKNPRQLRRVSVGEHVLVETDGIVWLPKEQTVECGPLMGSTLVTKWTFWAVLCGEQLLLLSESGELVDQLSPDNGLPWRPVRLGSRDGQLILEAADGIYRSADGLAWHRMRGETKDILWGKADVLRASEAKVWRQRYRAKWLNWERVLLDLHSGRVWGSYGPWLSDLVAILLIMLCLSGMYVWFRVYRKR